MNEALTFFAGSFAAVIGAYIIHFLTHNRWWREYRLRKLEELYVAVDNHVITVDEYYSRRAALLDMDEKTATNVKDAKKDFKEVYFTELREDEKKSSAILMIIDLYFEELIPAWQNLLDAKAALSVANKPAITVEHALEHGKTVPEETLNKIAKVVVKDLLGNALPKFKQAKTELLEKIVRVAEGIKDEKPWPFNNVEWD